MPKRAPIADSRPTSYVFGGFVLEPGRSLRGPRGLEIDLPARAEKVLRLLLEDPGRTVHREHLLSSAWPDVHVTDDALVQAVGALRRALGDDARRPRFIETVHGRGYRFIGELRSEPTTAATVAPALGSLGPARRLAAAIGVLAGLVLLAAAGRSLLEGSLGTAEHADAGAPTPVRFAVPVAEGRIPVKGQGSLAMSPDGRHVVFRVNGPSGTHLVHRALDDVESRPISGTEGADAPFFRPDGEAIGFFVGERLRTIPLSGGTARSLGTIIAPAGATWGPDGAIYVGTDDGVWRVPVGDPGDYRSIDGAERMTSIDASLGERGHWWPHVTPDGRALLFTVWTGSLAESAVAALDLDSRERHPLLRNASAPRVDVPGELTFLRGGTLLAIPFAADRPAPTGTARALATGVFAYPYTGAGHYARSRSGAIAYLTGDVTVAPAGRLRWHRATTSTEAEPDDDEHLPAFPGPVKMMRLSPDGRRLAAVVENGGGYRTWIAELADGRPRPVSATGALPPAGSSSGAQAVNNVTGASWSPDGERLAVAVQGRDHDLALVRAHDGQVVRRHSIGGDQFPTAWVEGVGIVYEQWSTGTGWDLWLWPFDGGADRPLATGPADERWGVVRPGGRLLAYVQTTAAGVGALRVGRLESDLAEHATVAEGELDWPTWASDGALLVRRRDVVARIDLALLSRGADGSPTRAADDASSAGAELSRVLTIPGLLHFAPHGDTFLVYVADEPDAHQLRIVLSQAD